MLPTLTAKTIAEKLFQEAHIYGLDFVIDHHNDLFAIPPDGKKILVSDIIGELTRLSQMNHEPAERPN